MAVLHLPLCLFVCVLVLLIVSPSPVYSFTFELNVDHPPLTETQSYVTCSNSQPLLCEMQKLKHTLAKLESSLEESNEELNAKSFYIVKCGKQIEDLTDKLHNMRSVLSDLKGSSFEDSSLTTLENEVKVLWDASRKNNFDLHVLESKVKDAETKLKAVASHAEQANIVTELWIQIQHLEQALQDAGMKTVYLKRQIRYMRCPCFKLIIKVSGRRIPEIRGMVDPPLFKKETDWWFYLDEASNHVKRLLTKVRNYHHQLQGLVKQGMEKNEVTASVANEEVVCFVASAMIVFPIMGAWMWMSSHWR